MMDVIMAMKSMIRSAEQQRDTTISINVGPSDRAPSANPLEQWMTGTASPPVRPRAMSEETTSQIYAARSPVLRHVGGWLLQHRLDQFKYTVDAD